MKKVYSFLTALLVATLLIPWQLNAQILLNENFDTLTSGVPKGWVAEGTYSQSWQSTKDSYTSGWENSYGLFFNCYSASTGLTAILKSPVINLSSSSKDMILSFYLYDAGENSNTFNLVALSNQDTKWVAFSPQTDYLLIIRNYIKETDFQSLLNKIKAIPRVVHAYVVDLGKNKKIDTILEDIELHEMNIFDEMNYRPKIKGES